MRKDASGSQRPVFRLYNKHTLVGSVIKVLRALIFLNFRNFGTKRDTTKKAKIKLIDLLKIERFYFVLFLHIPLRFKVTEVQKN